MTPLSTPRASLAAVLLLLLTPHASAREASQGEDSASDDGAVSPSSPDGSSGAGVTSDEATDSDGETSLPTQYRGDHPAAGAVRDPLDDGPLGDGVYGRFDGDMSLALGVGLEADPSVGYVRPSAWLALRVYQTVGPYLTYRQSVSDDDPLERALSIGATLEPLFIWRWSEAREFGRSFADLTLDSLSLSAGAYLSQPRGADFAAQAGAELGLGFGLPLLARAPGPWLRLRGLLYTGRPDLAGALWAHLEWQWFFEAGVLDHGERSGQ